MAEQLLGAAAGRAFAEAFPDPILITDQQGRIIFANQQPAALTGYDPDGLVGLPVETLVPERSVRPTWSIGRRSPPSRGPGRWARAWRSSCAAVTAASCRSTSPCGPASSTGWPIGTSRSTAVTSG
jgi:PAS domain-containing protein